MTTLFIEVRKLNKCGLFSWEKPKYETLFMSAKEFEDDEEANKAFESVSDWFVDPFDGCHRNWTEDWTNRLHKMLRCKTCHMKDVEYTVFKL